MANEYGVTVEGFKRKRLPEIIEDMTQRFEDKMGVQVDRSSTSVLYHNLSVIGYELSDIWSALQGTYNAMYPNTATGVSLTNAAGLTAIRPIPAENTEVYCTCYGDNGTLIPATSQVQDSQSNTYSSEVDTTISQTSTCDIYMKIDNVVVGTVYALTIDGTQKTHTAISGDTTTTILTAIYSQFTFTDRVFNLSNGILNVKMNDQSKTMSVIVSNITITNIGTPVKFIADIAGSINPTLNSIVTIITAVTGWDSVTNNVIASIGRDNETDIELRQRWSLSVYKKASAMVEAIQANVFENVSGVTACLVYENVEDVTDSDGRPPHSIEVVVAGGNNDDIGKEIFNYKSAGIKTYGSVTVEVNDKQGIPHNISFNRPTEVKTWIKVIVTKSNEEEWGDNNLIEIANIINNTGNNLGVGEDVILQKFIGDIYKNTSGVGYLNITATTGDTPGTYTANNIVISAREVAVFDLARIEVTLSV